MPKVTKEALREAILNALKNMDTDFKDLEVTDDWLIDLGTAASIAADATVDFMSNTDKE